jgi:GNAT superfamily N-acetyltransferase
VSQAPPDLSGELRVEDEPPPADVAALNDRLYRHKAAVTGCDNPRWLTIFVRDEARGIVAGLHGWTWGQTGFVQTLWVREDVRGRGLGARLLATAEVEAARRGCARCIWILTATRRRISIVAADTRCSVNCPGGPTKPPAFFFGKYSDSRALRLRQIR